MANQMKITRTRKRGGTKGESCTDPTAPCRTQLPPMKADASIATTASCVDTYNRRPLGVTATSRAWSPTRSVLRMACVAVSGLALGGFHPGMLSEADCLPGREIYSLRTLPIRGGCTGAATP